jgi:BirA family biotin operon repressor/biotin-[acetyl-CoA-carboxylase] ligase
MLPAGFRHLAYDSLGSTNSEALRLARTGTSGGLWITATEQTAGRGRRGKMWLGGQGNLAASVLLVDPTIVEKAATLSFVAGVALYEAVVGVAGSPIADRLSLKWPNDLLLDRFKVAGILVEGETLQEGKLGVVAGFGVNCASHPVIDHPVPPSDFLARGVDMRAEGLFEALAVAMADELKRWNRGLDFARTRERWIARAGGLGETIRVSSAGGSIEGIFDAIDEEGRLIVRTDRGREAIAAGDVLFPTVA